MLWHESCWWLIRQILLQLQLLFDLWFEHRGFSDNPLDHDADGPRRLGNQKDDAALKRAVTQGEGVSGAARAADPHAFARHFLQLRPRFGNEARSQLNVAHEHRKQLLNGLAAQRDYLACCRSVSLAADATRLSGQDRLFMSIIARHKSGVVTKAMWAPPQVSRL